MLGATIGKSNRVGTSGITSSITGFSSVESSLGVVISNSVLKSVGFSRAIICWRSMVAGGGMDKGSMYHGSVDNSYGSSMVNNGGSMHSMNGSGMNCMEGVRRFINKLLSMF